MTVGAVIARIGVTEIVATGLGAGVDVGVVVEGVPVGDEMASGEAEAVGVGCTVCGGGSVVVV